MAVSTTLIVRDPVDPYDLFGAARRVAGEPPLWHEHDFGDMRMLQAEGGQGAEAQVAVHFPAGGGPYREKPNPKGYAAVTFTNTGGNNMADCHERLVSALGEWLAGSGLRWVWRYEDGPWNTGGPVLRLRGRTQR